MTLIVVAAIVIVSIMGFNNRNIIDQLILDPYIVNKRKEWFRLLSCALIHADTMHLAFNMIALYSFGQALESYFAYTMPNMPMLMYATLLIGGQLASVLPSYAKHKDNYNYRSLGASGMVTAVIFAAIVFNPWGKIQLYFIPIPGIVFGLLYLAYEYYSSKNSNDNINHDAHYWGGVFGVLFVALTNPQVGLNFIEQLMHPNF